MLHTGIKSILGKIKMNHEKPQDNQFPERDSISLSPESEAGVVIAVFGNVP
jgi:hypothetical protein